MHTFYHYIYFQLAVHFLKIFDFVFEAKKQRKTSKFLLLPLDAEEFYSMEAYLTSRILLQVCRLRQKNIYFILK